MNILRKKIEMAFLTFVITFGVMLGSVQLCNADTFYYDNYYKSYQYYLGYYSGSGNTAYYYRAYAFYYYWLGCYYGDYYGYSSDSLGYKSPNYRGGTPYWCYYYDYYAYYGDYYYRL
jgi:hypothetical protein